MYKLKLYFISIGYFYLLLQLCSSATLASAVYSSLYSNTIPTVIGGYTAKQGDFPYQVSFKNTFRILYVSFCGGTIVGKRNILTAAHCFELKNSEGTSNRRFLFPALWNLINIKGRERSYSTKIQIKEPCKKCYAHVGSVNSVAVPARDSMANGQWRKLHEIIMHPLYNFPLNDIALVRIKRPFVYNHNVSPVPFSAVVNINYKECLLSGYGSISLTSPNAVPRFLHYASVHTQPVIGCEEMGSKKYYYICLTRPGPDIGVGDSGGPLVCFKTGDPNEYNDGILVGIACAKNWKSKVTLFTRVSIHRNFLKYALAMRSHDEAEDSCTIHYLNYSFMFLIQVFLFFLS